MDAAEHERRRRDRAAHLQPFGDSLGEGRLPGAEFTIGDDQVAGSQQRSQPDAEMAHVVRGGNHHPGGQRGSEKQLMVIQFADHLEAIALPPADDMRQFTAGDELQPAHAGIGRQLSGSHDHMKGHPITAVARKYGYSMQHARRHVCIGMQRTEQAADHTGVVGGDQSDLGCDAFLDVCQLVTHGISRRIERVSCAERLGDHLLHRFSVARLSEPQLQLLVGLGFDHIVRVYARAGRRPNLAARRGHRQQTFPR